MKGNDKSRKQSDERIEENPLNFELIREQKEKVEKFLRQISLNESISASRSVMSNPSVEGCNDELAEEEEHYLRQLFTLLSGENEKVNLSKLPPTTEIERKEFVNRRRRLRNLKRKEVPQNEELDEQQKSTANFTASQDQVKLIQKNVRGWLLRRQYLDTKFAVKILQSRKYPS